MIGKQLLIVMPLVFSLGGVENGVAQRRRASAPRRAPVDQVKLVDEYFAADAKCRGLLKAEKWKEAEVACLAETRIVDRFTDHRELEKLSAYEQVGASLAGQKRYAEAITYYLRALELSRPRLNDANADVGQLYGRIALAYHMMRDLGEAREFYRKATRTYQTAYANINEDEVVEEGLEMKRGYLKILKSMLEFHLIAAEQAGAPAEVEEIKKQLASLPK
jgi:tetratricopeptide (TPR) repeat protein